MKRLFLFLAFSLLNANVYATVNVEIQRVQYNCDGSKTTYAYDFRIYNDNDLVVIKSTSDNTETTLQLNTNYTVTGAGLKSGGNVVLNSGSECTSGHMITILREIKITQDTNYVNGLALSGVSIESDLDKIQLVNQDQEEKIGRAPKLKKSSTLTELELPNPAAGYAIGWNSKANGFTNISSYNLTVPQIDNIGNYENIEDAITTIGSSPITLMVNTAQTLDEGITIIIPETLTLWFTDGGSIDGVTGGKRENLIIFGHINAEPHQIFGENLRVTFGTGRGVWVDWFGTNTTPGTTDMTNAVQAAINSILDLGGEIKFKATTYSIDDLDIAGSGGITPGNAGPTFVGYGDNSTWVAANTNGGTILKASAGASYIMKLGDGTNYLYRTSFKNITFDGNSNESDCVYAETSGFTHFENCVFVDCLGAYVAYRTDRLTMTKVAFYSNTYGFYYDEDVHGTSDAISAISLVDIHHRSNNYNMYLDAERADAQIIVRGGYWASAVYSDVYVTGAAKSLIFDGVNFENTSDADNTLKPALFQMGMVNAGSHIGIDYVGIKNCLFQDNSAIADRPILMTVVDSGDTSNPSISTLEITGNLFFNVANTPLVAKLSSPTDEIDATSEINRAYWIKNSAPKVTPPVLSEIWRETASASTAGIGNVELNYYYLKNSPIQMPYLNRISSFTARANESGGFYTNEGASGTITFTLPAVTVGQAWYFINIEREVIRIAPQANEGFTDGSGVGKFKDLSNTVGHAALVIGVSATKARAWQAIPLNGANFTNE